MDTSPVGNDAWCMLSSLLPSVSNVNETEYSFFHCGCVLNNGAQPRRANITADTPSTCTPCLRTLRYHFILLFSPERSKPIHLTVFNPLFLDSARKQFIRRRTRLNILLRRLRNRLCNHRALIDLIDQSSQLDRISRPGRENKRPSLAFGLLSWKRTWRTNDET